MPSDPDRIDARARAELKEENERHARRLEEIDLLAPAKKARALEEEDRRHFARLKAVYHDLAERRAGPH
jgi:hypothetical protein